MSKFLHADDNDTDNNDDADNNDAKAIAIPPVFSKDRRAKNENAGPNQTLVIAWTRFTYWQSMLKVTVTLTFTPLTSKSKGNMYSISL